MSIIEYESKLKKFHPVWVKLEYNPLISRRAKTMSLFCPLASCKEQKGACKCEKIIGVIVVAAVLFALYRHFAA